MKNYLDEIYTVPEFKRDNSALAVQAEKALLYLKVRYPNSHNDDFVVIEVEGYNCIAYLTDEFSLYVLGKHIAPFDKEQKVRRYILCIYLQYYTTYSTCG